MAVLSEQFQITAPAPDAVMGISAQITGPPGLATYYYWWVANYPIGLSVVSTPVLVRGAPSPLTVANHITVTGQSALGATSYDLLRTNSPQLPSTAPNNIAVAGGLPSPTFQDVGGPLAAYDIIGLAAGAPVSEFISLNNRDFATPTLIISPFGLAVPGVKLTAGGLTFPDGSTQTTAPSAFTPTWTEYTVELVPPNWVVTSSSNPSTIVTPTAAAPTQDLVIGTLPAKAYILDIRAAVLNGPTSSASSIVLTSIGTLFDSVTNPNGSDGSLAFVSLNLKQAPSFVSFSDQPSSTGNTTLAAVSVIIKLDSGGPNINTFVPPIKFSVSILLSVTP